MQIAWTFRLKRLDFRELRRLVPYRGIHEYNFTIKPSDFFSYFRKKYRPILNDRQIKISALIKINKNSLTLHVQKDARVHGYL